MFEIFYTWGVAGLMAFFLAALAISSLMSRNS